MITINLVLVSVNNKKCNEEFLQKNFVPTSNPNNYVFLVIGDGLQEWTFVREEIERSKEQLKKAAQDMGDEWWNLYEGEFINQLKKALIKFRSSAKYEKGFIHKTYEIDSEFKAKKDVSEKIAIFNRLAERYDLPIQVLRWEDFIKEERRSLNEFLKEMHNNDVFFKRYEQEAHKYAARHLEDFKGEKLNNIQDNEQYKLLFEEYCNIYLRLVDYYHDRMTDLTSRDEKSSSIKKKLSEFYAELLFEQFKVNDHEGQKQSFFKSFEMAFNRDNYQQNVINIEKLKKISGLSDMYDQSEPEGQVDWLDRMGKEICNKYNVALEEVKFIEAKAGFYKNEIRFYNYRSAFDQQVVGKEKKVVSLMRYNGHYLPILKADPFEKMLNRPKMNGEMGYDSNQIKNILVEFINIDNFTDSESATNDNTQSHIESIKKIITFFNKYFEGIKIDYRYFASLVMEKVFNLSVQWFLLEESPVLILALEKLIKKLELKSRKVEIEEVCITYPGVSPVTVQEAAKQLFFLYLDVLRFVNSEKASIPKSDTAQSLIDEIVVKIASKSTDIQTHILLLVSILVESIWIFSRRDKKTFLSILSNMTQANTLFACAFDLNLNPSFSSSFPPFNSEVQKDVLLANKQGFFKPAPEFLAMVAEFKKTSQPQNARITNQGASKSSDSLDIPAFLRPRKKHYKESCPLKEFFIKEISEKTQIQPLKPDEKELMINYLCQAISYIGKNKTQESSWAELFLTIMLVLKEHKFNAKIYLEKLQAIIKDSLEEIDTKPVVLQKLTKSPTA